jgi:hypothetical protein
MNARSVGRRIRRVSFVIASIGAFASVSLPATPVLAHGGTGGANSDYRVDITGYEGSASGFELRVVELGNRMEIERTSAEAVTVLGYEGEPYLRLDSTGVWENLNSPAHYLNLDRFARSATPDTATADAAPQWSHLSAGKSVRWHDHRTHWMDVRPPENVRADPSVERVVFAANRIDLLVDGLPVVAIIKVTWLPPPARMWWLVSASLLGCIIAGAFVLTAWATRFRGPMCVLACGAATIAQSGSAVRTGIGLALMLLAVITTARPRWARLAMLPAAGAAVLCLTRLEVLEHTLLAGAVPPPVQRLACVIAIGLGLGVVTADIVGWLGATPSAAIELSLPVDTDVD